MTMGESEELLKGRAVENSAGATRDDIFCKVIIAKRAVEPC